MTIPVDDLFGDDPCGGGWAIVIDNRCGIDCRSGWRMNVATEDLHDEQPSR